MPSLGPVHQDGPVQKATPDWPVSAFWTFSLRVYRCPGVASACLALQDDLRLDVNLVLLAAWAASTHRRLDAVTATRLRQVSEPYQSSVMQPLREARRRLADAFTAPPLAALAADRRERLKALELDCERLEQLALQTALADQPTDKPGSADLAERFRQNLALLYPEHDVPGAAFDPITRVVSQALATPPGA